VNIATHEEVGGDGDGIEWVVLSAEIADRPRRYEETGQ
jgi:hypothetical protein